MVLKKVLRDVLQAGEMSGVAGQIADGVQESEIVSRSREILGVSFEESLSVGDLAKRAGCSVTRLSRLLRMCTGWSPHRYLVELRLREAVTRLALSASELSPIAHDLGFSSHSHFTYWFRRRFGLCPSRLRNAVEGSDLGLLGEKTGKEARQGRVSGGARSR